MGFLQLTNLHSMLSVALLRLEVGGLGALQLLLMVLGAHPLLLIVLGVLQLLLLGLGHSPEISRQYSSHCTFLRMTLS